MGKKKLIRLSNLLKMFNTGAGVEIYDVDNYNTHIGSYYDKKFSYNYDDYEGNKDVEAYNDKYAVEKISFSIDHCEVYITDDFEEKDIAEDINLETISLILPDDEALTCYSIGGQTTRFATYEKRKSYEEKKFVFFRDEEYDYIDPVDVCKSHSLIKFLMKCPIKYIDMDYEYDCLALNYDFAVRAKTAFVITKKKEV